jgi:hypothetical protein
MGLAVGPGLQPRCIDSQLHSSTNQPEEHSTLICAMQNFNTPLYIYLIKLHIRSKARWIIYTGLDA